MDGDCGLRNTDCGLRIADFKPEGCPVPLAISPVLTSSQQPVVPYCGFCFRLLLNRASMLALSSGKKVPPGRETGFFMKPAFFLNAL